MNTKSTLLYVLATLAIACGNPVPGQEGAGVIFRVREITADPTDIATVCDANGQKLRQKSLAKVTLENKPVGKQPPIDINVERYSITYEPIDGGPNLDSQEFLHTLSVGGDSIASFDAEFVPIVTKEQFEKAVTGTTNEALTFNYRVSYLFEGRTELREPVQAVGDTTITMGTRFIASCKQ